MAKDKIISMKPSNIYMHQLTNHNWLKYDLLSRQCQAIIWTNAGILLIWALGTNLSEILIENHKFSF